MSPNQPRRCPGITRRSFLADTGMGFTGLVLGAMLFRDGVARADEDRRDRPAGSPQLTPKAKSVIWLFMCGGVSHVESFDVKPELNKYAGKTFAQTPYPDPLKSPLHDKRSRSVVNDTIDIRDKYATVYPLTTLLRILVAQVLALTLCG